MDAGKLRALAAGVAAYAAIYGLAVATIRLTVLIALALGYH